MSEINDATLQEFYKGLSPRTQQRIKDEIARGDYRRITSLIEKRILYPNHDAHNPVSFQKMGKAYSYRTEQRRQRDIRSGRTTADRPDFVAWDGEGRESGGRHRYTLLANSRGEYLESAEGLSTRQLLEFMVKGAHKRTVNIFFSFGYDVQQIVADLDDINLEKLMHGYQVYYEGYRLQYFSGKIFIINNYVRFYDIFSFFHKSFIKAVAGVLGPDRISKELVEGKEARSDFNSWSLEKIRQYNDVELALLAELGEKLREIFLTAGIELRSSYYGPGAIARFWYRKFKIKPIPVSDPDLLDIFERAYFGGRFETFTLGKVSPVYEYDLHSAYPSAIRELRYVDDWVSAEQSTYDVCSQFSVWHVEWHLPESTKVGPFPSRDRRGLISYPANGKGWYYKPEVDAALTLYSEGITLLEGRNPQIVSEDKPFWWVESMYDKRAELKEQGNPAEWALKVGLNSLYGKTAQRVGTNTFFCLPWAGWITSKTRAKLLLSVYGKTGSVIAFATDATYSTEELPSLALSEKLGDWEYKTYNEGYFIQSGVYRLIGESTKDAYRGFHSEDGLQPIFDQIAEMPSRSPAITQTRFVTHMEAIKFPKALGPHRLKFIELRKALAPYRPTKRILSDEELLKVYVVRTIHDSDREILGEPVYIIQRLPRDVLLVVYPNYALLTERPIQTRILENMNDHRDPFYTHTNVLGPFEESYPFRKLILGQDKEVNGEPDVIATERLGGVRGNIENRNGPVVEETDLIMELK